MSYIRTIAWGMLDPTELKGDERYAVFDELRRELKSHGFSMSHWPMSKFTVSKRRRLNLKAEDAVYVITHPLGTSFTGPLRTCCKVALTQIQARTILDD